MEPLEILKDLEKRLNSRPEVLDGLDALYRLRLSGARGGDFHLRIKDRTAAIEEATEGAAPDATVSLADTDFVALVEGDVDGMSLFMDGKIKIEGDMGVALRLESLLRS